LAIGFGAMKKLTIYEALKAKLGREPTNAEIKADVKRILQEGLIEQAGKGKLRHQRRKNPSRASVICAQRKGRKGEVMYWDGKKFTNNNPPKYFGTHDRARGVAQILVKRFKVLQAYKVWVGPPLASMRRRNPESLDEAARRLEDFSGHAVKKTIQVSPRSHQTTGLVIGELDLIGYRTKRAGIAAGKLIRYAHDFRKGSRPLLAVSSDGKQLHIVGGQYEFTEAGVEDR
jgi:hypothetical protein